MVAEFLELAGDVLGREDAYAFIAMGVGVFTAVVALFYLRDPDRMDERRLRRREAAAAAVAEALRSEAPDRWLGPIAGFLEPSRPQDLRDAQMTLVRAGYRSRFALRLYYLSRILGAVALSLFGLVIGALYYGRPEIGAAVGAAAGGAIGFLLPGVFVLRQRQARQEALRDAFPDALDMLLVCVESGQSVDLAINRVALEIEAAHPALASELSFLSAQLRAGVGRAEALRGLAVRTDAQEIASFATVLIQSSETGASIGRALRVYADEMRLKRTLRAEERANLLPMKLALGSMAFTLPPLMIVILGPSIIQFLSTVQGLSQ